MDDIPVIPAPMKANIKLDNIGRQRVDEMLFQIALQKTAFAKADDPLASQLEARRVLALTMRMAAHVVGDDALSAIYMAQPDDAGREDHLAAVSQRLLPLVFLYGPERLADKSPGSLTSILEELDAIEHGDEPRLFARLDDAGGKGFPTNARRMARHKLRALQWSAYLEGRGVDRPTRHFELDTAFNSTVPVIRQWRDQVARDLGADFIAREIGNAGRGLPPFDAEWTEAEWKAQLAEDGRDFIKERWRK